MKPTIVFDPAKYEQAMVDASIFSVSELAAKAKVAPSTASKWLSVIQRRQRLTLLVAGRAASAVGKDIGDLRIERKAVKR